MSQQRRSTRESESSYSESSESEWEHESGSDESSYIESSSNLEEPKTAPVQHKVFVPSVYEYIESESEYESSFVDKDDAEIEFYSSEEEKKLNSKLVLPQKRTRRNVKLFDPSQKDDDPDSSGSYDSVDNDSDVAIGIGDYHRQGLKTVLQDIKNKRVESLSENVWYAKHFNDQIGVVYRNCGTPESNKITQLTCNEIEKKCCLNGLRIEIGKLTSPAGVTCCLCGMKREVSSEIYNTTLNKKQLGRHCMPKCDALIDFYQTMHSFAQKLPNKVSDQWLDNAYNVLSKRITVILDEQEKMMRLFKGFSSNKKQKKNIAKNVKAKEPIIISKGLTEPETAKAYASNVSKSTSFIFKPKQTNSLNSVIDNLNSLNSVIDNLNSLNSVIDVNDEWYVDENGVIYI